MEFAGAAFDELAFDSLTHLAKLCIRLSIINDGIRHDTVLDELDLATDVWEVAALINAANNDCHGLEVALGIVVRDVRGDDADENRYDWEA